MIIDNSTELEIGGPTFPNPLVTYFKDSYSLSGNILSEISKHNTLFIIEIPNINFDASILFKLWFFEKLKNLLSDVTKFNLFIKGKGINQKILLKESDDSLIVQPEIKSICIINDGRYTFIGNGTIRYEILFFEKLPIDMCKLIEELFKECVDVFRKNSMTHL